MNYNNFALKRSFYINFGLDMVFTFIPKLSSITGAMTEYSLSVFVVTGKLDVNSLATPVGKPFKSGKK